MSNDKVQATWYPDEFTHPSIPGLRVYASPALQPGQGIQVGDKLFLSPKAVHELRKQAYAMNTDRTEPDFTFPAAGPQGPRHAMTKRAARKLRRQERTRQLPFAAKLGAAFVLVSVLAVILFGYVGANNAGKAYEECVNQKTAEAGFDSPNQTILDECQ